MEKIGRFVIEMSEILRVPLTRKVGTASWRQPQIHVFPEIHFELFPTFWPLQHRKNLHHYKAYVFLCNYLSITTEMNREKAEKSRIQWNWVDKEMAPAECFHPARHRFFPVDFWRFSATISIAICTSEQSLSFLQWKYTVLATLQAGKAAQMCVQRRVIVTVFLMRSIPPFWFDGAQLTVFFSIKSN